MRYALISDIHGNFLALEAVLNDARKKDIDSYIFLGDYCRDFNYPNEVVDVIRDIENKHIIRGNSEDYLDIVSKQDQSTWEKGQFNSLRWCYKELTESNRNFLSALPDEKTISDKHTDIYIFHSAKKYFDCTLLSKFTSGSFEIATKNIAPKKYLEIIRKQLLEDEALLGKLSRMPDGVYTYGHNHIQINLKIGNKLIVNPGSCGMPLDYPYYASYSILETSSEGCLIEEFRIPYDIKETIRRLKDSDLYGYARVWSEIMIITLETGRTHVGNFLRFIDNYAEKPYSQEVWEEAYELWNKQN